MLRIISDSIQEDLFLILRVLVLISFLDGWNVGHRTLSVLAFGHSVQWLLEQCSLRSVVEENQFADRVVWLVQVLVVVLGHERRISFEWLLVGIPGGEKHWLAQRSWT